MSLAFASFGHVARAMCGSPPGPVRGPPPGRVSPSVHAHEDQHDEQQDDDDKHASAGEVMTRPADDNRDTGHHYLAPTE
jgi:hypothetical protein